MRGFTKAVVAGNLTRDPELRNTASGQPVCSFSIASSRVFKSNGETRETVSFFDCAAWGRTGETIAQYAKKGSGMVVSGRLEQHSWDDKTTGARRSRVEVVVDDFIFAGGSDNRDGGSSYGGGSSSGGSSYNGGSYSSGGESGFGGFNGGDNAGGNNTYVPAGEKKEDNKPAEDVVPTEVPADDSVPIDDIPF